MSSSESVSTSSSEDEDEYRPYDRGPSPFVGYLPFHFIESDLSCYPLHQRQNARWRTTYRRALALLSAGSRRFRREELLQAMDSGAAYTTIPVAALKYWTDFMVIVPKYLIVYGSKFADHYNRLCNHWCSVLMDAPHEAGGETCIKFLSLMTRPDIPSMPAYSLNLLAGWEAGNAAIRRRFTIPIINLNFTLYQASFIMRTAYDQDYANVIQDLVEEALVARTIFCARVRITRYPTGGIYQPPMEELMDWTQAFVHFPKEQIVYGTPVALEYIALSSQWLTVLRHRPDNRTAGSDLINQYGGIVKNMLDLMAAPHIPAFPTRLS
ncbi:hypothetical protein GALMADRAFT_217741, partial [Galerina marginata CBS 339.88]